MLIQQFRDAVYHKFSQRPDATMDLLDALTIARHVESPVALSTESPFRRHFSSVYDVLAQKPFEPQPLHQLLHDAQPSDAECVAGFRVYAVDTTPNERPAAETLPDRGLLKDQVDEPARIGFKFSWLARLVQRGTSWIAPWDVCRVPTNQTENQSARQQVAALAQIEKTPTVIVADSRYASHIFLGLFATVRQLFALVRLRNNQVLYERPVPKQPGARGAARKHGPRLKLAAPTRPPDRSAQWQVAGQAVQLQAWLGVHLKKLPTLVGLVLKVEFLKPDGSPRYRHPIWLFWTGDATLNLADLARMYLWRFALEHGFRFLKQHLGLNANRSAELISVERWMWLSALAYWQLLLMRSAVTNLRPAWHRRTPPGESALLTPGQVQRGAARFLVGLGTPAGSTRRAGKGRGRQAGYRPMARTRYPVVRKSQRAVLASKKQT